MEHTYLPEGQLLTTLRNREYTTTLSGLERAMDTGAIIEGTVLLCDSDFNLHVDFPALPGVRGIIPREEAVWSHDGEPAKDIAILTRVGKTIACKVTGLEQQENGGTTVHLSRRLAQAECAARFLNTLVPGDIIRAKVTHLENFGAFVDIGCGIPSLLSVDTISVSRISHPRDRLYNGQLIWAVVRSIDRGTGRIFVSTRELLGTWEQNAARFTPGQTVAGIVRSVEEYGVFVELAPNLAGLAEVRDCDREAVHSLVGRTAAVFIKSIIPERMKIKLVLIDAHRGDPVPLPRLHYFIRGDEVEHIDRWIYSPAGARKRVETVFGS
ncbi:MAG: 30S ribosomal protein S1 [Clostridia bacterium]|jgi:small subunit ribosomal protein S1|nr:30S ribosomal protein S1 [Clostridia bacterium]